MENLSWCMKQKNGIKIVEPNENLMKGYFLKAKNSLDAMWREKGNIEWQVAAAYYAMYFSVYAILAKIGITCEIHSCTVKLAKLFLSENDITILETAKTLRNRIQYYVTKQDERTGYLELISKAHEFNLKCRSLASSMTEPQINKLRNTITQKKSL